MKTLVTAFALVAFTGTAFAGKTNAKDEDAIKAVAAALDTAWNKGDAKAAAANFADDATLVNPFGQRNDGKTAIEAHLTGMLTGPMKGSTHTVTLASITLLKGDVALADGDAEVSGMKGPDGKAAPALKVKASIVYTKKAGKWLVSAVRAYTFLPPPPSPIAAAPKK